MTLKAQSLMILGFDPGRDKCGIAIMGREGQPQYHEVVSSETAIAQIKTLCQQYFLERVVMGDRTTAKTWRAKIEPQLPKNVPIVLVDEHNSSLEARDRYWQMYPPQGLTRLIPQGMRLPPRPVDDIVAILLIERYLRGESSNRG